ncbi:MAG: SUMF1/EgtB/PvdO family nonheme iron enzyme, partial [Pseudomonadota bacterium]
ATGSVDASSEKCPSAGATRIAACGYCGKRSEACKDGVWQPASDCLGQGVCPVGAVEIEALPRCGERQRFCDEQCQWIPWQVTAQSRDCEPGIPRAIRADCPFGQLREQICTAECSWANTGGACVEACTLVTGRTTPEDREEICIPAGPFIRGSELDEGATPVREVTLSAYYIDRFPATNRRYKECIDAGACAGLSREQVGPFAGLVEDPALADYVALVPRGDAVSLCEWDGGRRLPTEAEWEKAARGPEPRNQLYTWEGNNYRCDLLDSAECGFDFPPEQWFGTDIYDSLPGTRSYYGVEMLLGGGRQWVLDYFATDYYSHDESLFDPIGPSSGSTRVVRGDWRDESNVDDHVSSRKQSAGELDDASMCVARCARSVLAE